MPPITLQNSAAGGANGVVPTPGSGGNTGGVSGNFFTQAAVGVGVGASLLFDNTHSIDSTLAYLASTGTGTGQTALVAWDKTAMTSMPTAFYGRIYIYLAASPGGTLEIMRFFETGGVQIGGVEITSGNLLRTVCGTSPITTGPTPIPSGEWVRVEANVISSATVGGVQIQAFYTDPESINPDQSFADPLTQNTTGGALVSSEFGITLSLASMQLWFDGVGLSDTVWLGPVGAASPGGPTILSNTAAAGTNGVTPTPGGAGNTGGGSGTPLSGVTIGAAGCTMTFDNTHSIDSTLAYKIATGSAGSGNATFVDWDNTAMPNGTTVYARVYLYLTGAPPSALEPIRLFTLGGAQVAAVEVDTTLHVHTLNSSGSATASTAVVPLNAWFRIEAEFVSSATAGGAIARVYTTDPEATLPNFTVTDTFDQNTNGGNIVKTCYGANLSLVSYTFWMDGLGLSNSTWLGPLGTPTPPTAIVLTNNASGGTGGTTPTAANTGGASGNAFPAGSIVDTGATLTFDATQHIDSALSFKAVTTTATPCYLGWDSTIFTSTPTTFYARIYIYLTAAPVTALEIMRFFATGGQVIAGVSVTNALTVETTDSAGVATTSGNVLPLNQWIRAEDQVVSSATSGGSVVRVYVTDPEATIPDFTVTDTRTRDTNGGGVVKSLFGITLSLANYTLNFGVLGLSDGTWLGPAGTVTPVRLPQGPGLLYVPGGTRAVPVGTGKFGCDLTTGGWPGSPSHAAVRNTIIADYLDQGLGPHCKFFSGAGFTWSTTYANFMASGYGGASNELEPVIVAQAHDTTAFTNLIHNMAANWGKKWWVCFFNEPEPQFLNGSLTIAGYQDTWQSMQALRAASGGDGTLCNFIVCCENYQEQDASPGVKWTTFLPGLASLGVDLQAVGWDVYDSLNQRSTWSFANYLPQIQASAAFFEVPWALMEYGLQVSTASAGDTVSAAIGRMSAMTELAAADPNFLYANYWLDDDQYGFLLLQNPSAMAVLQELVGV